MSRLLENIEQTRVQGWRSLFRYNHTTGQTTYLPDGSIVYSYKQKVHEEIYNDCIRRKNLQIFSVNGIWIDSYLGYSIGSWVQEDSLDLILKSSNFPFWREAPLVPEIPAVDSLSVTELEDKADKWAAEFNKAAVKLGYSKMDEGWLIGWFANAIEGSQQYRNQQKEKKTNLALNRLRV